MGGIVKILVGSKAFFSKFDDFNPKDEDYMLIMNNPPKNKKYQFVRFKNLDYFIYKKMSKLDFINFIINSKSPMYAGMFIAPEFIDYIGLNIEDLDLLQNVFEHMDDKHSYEKMIYNYYKQNNGFYLTDEQLEAVYMDYKSKRKKSYSAE